MELLDIVDEFGEPTGETVEREEAHLKGIRHRTSHLWLINLEGETPKILLQIRSKTKDSYPGCYDISSAGHIPAGFGFKESAIRELNEELGVTLTEDKLTQLGKRKFEYEAVFNGKYFHDNQISNVYIAEVPLDVKIVHQESELEGTEWMDFTECTYKVRNNLIPHCIRDEELIMIEKYIAERK